MPTGPPGHVDSVASTVQEARKGTIDALSGLKGDRVWIFIGGREEVSPHDTLVPHKVVKELKEYYKELFAQSEVSNGEGNIAFVDSIQVEHAMVTDAQGADQCSRFRSPLHQ